MFLRRILVVILLCGSLGFAACERDSGAASEEDAGRAILRRGNGGDPGSLDPGLAEDVHAFNVLTDMFEGLVSIDSSGSVTPGVARSWTISSDGRDYLFKLRDNAAWSDGRPVIASDFVSSFRRVASADFPATYSFLLAPIQNFEAVKSGSLPSSALGVSAIDEHTLGIRLTTGTPYFLSILAMPIASPVRVETQGNGGSYARNTQVSNGPFRLSERIVNGPIRLTRNPYYWDATGVAVDEVVFLPIVDVNAELNMYRSGELDITNSIPPSYYEQLLEKLGTEVRIAPSLALYYLAFDLVEAPFDKPNVRKALAMTVDRQQLVALVGRGEIAAHGIVPPGVSSHNHATYPTQGMSQHEREELAKSYLVAEGYGPDNPLRFTLTYDAGDIHELVALAVASMWQRSLDVNVTLEKLEWKLLLANRVDRPAWEMMRFAWSGDYDDPMTFLEIFRSGSPQNLPLYNNPGYDELLHDASFETDLERRAQLMARAEAMLIQDYPVIPLYFYVSKHLVKPNILGFSENVLDRHPSKTIIITPGSN